jgi:hypothetical protein
MTTLNHRLYAWLLESDERRFEFAFKAYFDVAYPSVMRRLARLSRWDPVHLEELAQDALLRFSDDAIETFHKAQKSGRGAAERRRVDALTDKFSRSMSVLSILGEGYTQEQTAERLGLSRNQVKYIIESVQEAYARFAADFACPATLSPTAVGQSHVA